MKTLLKKKFLIISLLLSAIVLIWIIFQWRNPNLKIVAVPSGSTIFVGDQLFEGQVNKRFPMGTYEITVRQEGFNSKSQTITLKEDMEIEFVLTQSAKSAKASIPQFRPFGLFNIQSTSTGDFLAINRFTEQLIDVRNNSVFSNQKVSTFSHGGSIVAIISKDNPNAIQLFSYPSGEKLRDLTDSSIKNITDISITKDGSRIFWLSNYDLRTSTSDLYYSNTQNYTPTALFKTTSTEISSLSNNKILLFTFGEAINQGRIEIYNLDSQELVTTERANNYVALENKVVYYTTSSAKFYNAETNRMSSINITIPQRAKVKWLNSSEIIVLAQEDEAITIFNIDTNEERELELPDDLKDTIIVDILGSSHGIVFLEDQDGEIIALEVI